MYLEHVGERTCVAIEFGVLDVGIVNLENSVDIWRKILNSSIVHTWFIKYI
jgi:hypothetical protein